MAARRHLIDRLGLPLADINPLGPEPLGAQSAAGSRLAAEPQTRSRYLMCA